MKTSHKDLSMTQRPLSGKTTDSSGGPVCNLSKGAVCESTGDVPSSRGVVYRPTGKSPTTVPRTEALAHLMKLQKAALKVVPGDKDCMAVQVSFDSISCPSLTIAGRGEHNTAATEQGGAKCQVHFSMGFGLEILQELYQLSSLWNTQQQDQDH